MGWLLDTNIISQLAPGRTARTEGFSQWMQRHSGTLFLSTISVVEIGAGIAKLRTNDSFGKADAFRVWLDDLVRHYGEVILSVDVAVATIAGDLVEQARVVGQAPGLADILIAATAKAHGLGLITDNTRHFEPLKCGIRLLNPLREALP